MKITCIDKEIRKVFETGYYYIPRFQRPYSWEKDQVAEFWHDSIVDSESDYFIGSIVVYKKNDEAYGIVDGQQRLTTITMMLCALRNAYQSEEIIKLAKGIHVLIEKSDLYDRKQYIIQTETSYPYFQEHIQKFGLPDVEVEIGSEEINLKTAFAQLSNYVQQAVDDVKYDRQIKKEDKKVAIEQKLNEIRDKLLKLKVIYIELDNEDDAYVIFETLNTRGKDLSVGDLVKNYLTKLIKAKNAGVDIAKDKWNLIRDNIDSTTVDLAIDTFLSHVWLSKYEFTTTKTLYKKIKSEVKSNQAKQFLDNLVNDSEIYKTIFDTQVRKWSKNESDLKGALDALYSFKVTQQTPMVLSIMREYNAGKLRYKYTVEALTAIEHFHYIFTAITSQRSSGSIASMYSLYARRLHDAKDDESRVAVLRELKKRMKDKLPTYGEFLASFRTIRFTNDYTKQKKIVQYTLSKIDRYLNQSGTAINYEQMTIEHLYPQNPKVKAVSHDEYVGLLGNLVLVDEKTNIRLASKSFQSKKLILEKTNVHLDELILNASEWTFHDIESRTAKLATLAYTKVFKL